MKFIALPHPVRLTIAACLLLASSLSQVYAQAVKPTYSQAATLPEIWEKAGPRERLKATRAAELDGDRLLVERIYGLRVDADTSVADLALEDDAVNGAVQATLVGAVSTEEPEYLPDGTVQVVRSVKIQEVVDRLNRTIKGTRLDDGSFRTISNTTKTDRKTNEKLLYVLGNAALPDSEGQVKVLAKRAAELDAYRRLAGRMMGVEITTDTTVRDMCVENDQIVAALAHVLKGARPTAIDYKSDGTCKVTMEVEVERILRTVERHIKGEHEKVKISDKKDSNTFVETGIGAARPAGEGEDMPTGTMATAEISGSANDPFFEAKVVLQEVVKSEPVVQ